MIGPILLLRIKGICPCFIKEEDRIAQEAISTLHHIPIRWHQRSASSSNRGIKFVSSLFGGGGSKTADTAISWNSESAYLSVIDTISGPALNVTLAKSDNNDEMTTSVAAMTVESKRNIPLNKIAEAGPVDSFFCSSRSGIIVHGSRGKKNSDGELEELLRFDLKDSDGSDDDADSEQRDDVMDKITILAEWVKRSRSHTSNYNDSEVKDEEEWNEQEGSSNIIGDNMSKIKHFAQREIEMKKIKKEREEKKAKYMNDSGGLKYTAIAMAARAEKS